MGHPRNRRRAPRQRVPAHISQPLRSTLAARSIPPPTADSWRQHASRHASLFMVRMMETLVCEVCILALVHSAPVAVAVMLVR